MNNLYKQAGANFRPSQAGTPVAGNLLQKALDLHLTGQFGPAATLYGEILESDPTNFDALHLLGMAAHQTGDQHGALAMVDKALAIRPDSADALSNRSAILMELGLAERALESCEQSLLLNSNNPEAHYNAGNALASLGQRQEAIERYHTALSARPNFPSCLTNMAGELIELGRLQEAVELTERAIELDPSHRKAWLNLGVALQEAGEFDNAVLAFQRAIELDATYTRAFVNLATLHLNLGGITPALNTLEAGLKQDPQSAELHNCAGNCLRALGEPAKAAQHYRLAVTGKPKTSSFHSNLLLTMLGDPAETPDTIRDEAFRFGARFVVSSSTPDRSDREPRRIGFISGDFRGHPVGYFVEPLLTGLKGFETFLYANQSTTDAHSERLNGLASQWRTVHALNDVQLRQLIREDGIDVLIDCSGHTAGGRLEALSERLAPLQLTWLGYSGTTGVSQFDGLVGDSIVTPRNHEEGYIEPLLRLPNTFAPVFKPKDLAPTTPLPADKTGHITFGSFNALSKLNDEVLTTWAEILKSVDGSRLVMKSLYSTDPTAKARVSEILLGSGVSQDCFEFVGQTSAAEHYQWLASIDIALDSFPYSGATTTIDSLWSGVPVLTILGDRYAGRMSASFLSALQLSDWIANNRLDYVQRAQRLSADLVALRDVRSGLRMRLESCPSAEASEFASGFVNVLSGAWRAGVQQAA